MAWFLFIFFFFNLSQLIHIILHELGHALPAIIFSRQPVDIYIGSYGNGKHLRCKIGKLTINIKPRISYIAARGLCKHKPVSGFYQNFIILASGALFSFLVALIALIAAINIEMHGSVRMLVFVTFISAILGLIINLWPSSATITLANEGETYNDGYQLFTILRRKKNWEFIKEAFDLVRIKEYGQALNIFEKFDHPKGDVKLFSVVTACYCLTNKYEEGMQYINKYFKHLPAKLLSSELYARVAHTAIGLKLYETALDYYHQAIFSKKDDAELYIHRGYNYLMLKEYQLANDDLSKAIDMGNQSIPAYQNRGYSYIMLKDYQKALSDFDKIIAIDEQSSISHNNRGYTLIHLDQPEAALDAINLSLKLDSTSANAIGSLAFYHLKFGDSKLALELFEKAKSIDPEIPEIDDYIEQARQKVAETATL